MRLKTNRVLRDYKYDGTLNGTTKFVNSKIIVDPTTTTVYQGKVSIKLKIKSVNNNPRGFKNLKTKVVFLSENGKQLEDKTFYIPYNAPSSTQDFIIPNGTKIIELQDFKSSLF